MKSSLLVSALVLATSLLSLAACTQPTSAEDSEAKSVVQQIRYVKDARSELCFAVAASRTYGAYVVLSIAEVPCDKVEKLLAQ